MKAHTLGEDGDSILVTGTHDIDAARIVAQAKVNADAVEYDLDESERVDVTLWNARLIVGRVVPMYHEDYSWYFKTLDDSALGTRGVSRAVMFDGPWGGL